MHLTKNGFTLLEIIIVIAILGLVSLILINRVSSSTATRFESERIKQINDLIYDEITQIWKLTGTKANTLATNSLLLPGNSWLDVVVFGDKYISDNYQTYFKNHLTNDVGHLIEVRKPPSKGNAGKYSVAIYPISINQRDDSGLTITYKDLNPQLINSVSKKYNEPNYDVTSKQDFNGNIHYTINNDLLLVLDPIM